MAQKSKSFVQPKPPRRDQGDQVSDAFALDVPFGGQQVGWCRQGQKRQRFMGSLEKAGR